MSGHPIKISDEWLATGEVSRVPVPDIYITMGDRQVAIRADAPWVLMAVQREFRAMLDFTPRKVVANLEVVRSGARYHLLRSCVGGNKSLMREGPPSEILSSLRNELLMSLIRARIDLLWLHAGAISQRGRTIILPASSGSGKSTLVTNLCARGWTYLSDEFIPIDLPSVSAFPFPLTPMVREDPGRDLPQHLVQHLKKIEVTLRPDAICREAMPIMAVIFPEYRPRGPAELERCSPAGAALELLRHCISFPYPRQEAIREICKLAGLLPAFRLPYSNRERAADLIADIYHNRQRCERDLLGSQQ